MDSKKGKNVENDESDKNNRNDKNENYEENEQNEGGKKDMKSCFCELFCGPSRPFQTCCNVDEPKLICKRCCCNMNCRVEAILIPENVVEMIADKMADKVVKMEERAVAKKKLSISPDFDNKSTTSKKGDVVDEKKVLSISPDFDTKSTTSKKGDAVDEKKVLSISPDFDTKSTTSKKRDAVDEKKVLSISPDFDNKSTTSKKGDAVDEKEVHRKKVKKYSIYSAKFDAEGNPIKIRESRRKARSVSGDGEADETPAEFDETPDEDKTNKTKKKIKNRRTTKVANSETTKNNDHSDADDNRNGGASSNERLQPNGNYGNGMQSIIEENTKTATAALETDCDRHSKACCFDRSTFCVCMCTPCICPQKDVESNAEKRDSELIGEIWESMAAVVKDNLDKNFDNYFSCYIAKIEELAKRTKRNEYLLKRVHKDLKLRISFLDRFMTQINENNDDCKCECTCEDYRVKGFLQQRERLASEKTLRVNPKKQVQMTTAGR